MLVSVVTPLGDDYETYEKGKCIFKRFGRRLRSHSPRNDESLGRELRTDIQTEKYLARKNDGTLLESTKRT